MSEAPPFAGIASFFKAPYVAEPTKADGDVAVLGIPFDEGTTSRAGTRYGPRALRSVSTFWTYRENGEAFHDGEAGATILDGVRFVDTGDVELAPMTPVDVAHPAIAGRVQRLVAAGLFPVVLGGDHSITFPVLQGLSAARPQGAPLHLVHLDTHMDYWQMPSKYTHASPIINAHEGGIVTAVTQYGIRGLHTADDNIALAGERGVRTFWCEPAKATPVDELVAHIEPGSDVYISLDIDVLDPAIAPGTGTPEPGGFTYYEAKALLRAVALRTHVVGMDLVEVNPLYDPAELTALHGVRLLVDTIGAALAPRGGQA